ncbi:HAD family hydrolase [Legionella dresdenensis]|uniref:HAD family hydrolase n=1 Tax=Legionella dresdenensis TaxID=450200 RepID=A0ABV8CGN5_9GAMM
MSKQYRLVVFDWEGTLCDTLGQVIHCVENEARRLNFGELDWEIASQSVELGLNNAIRKVFPHLSPEQHYELVNAVQTVLVSRGLQLYLFPGAKETIEQLHQKGIDLAIASNKGQQSLMRAVQQSGLDDYFKVIKSASQSEPKPSPQMLEEILAIYSLPAGEALMVGDSLSDIKMAKSIGVDAIGVDFYHQNSSALMMEGALGVFHDYKQIARFLNLSEE